MMETAFTAVQVGAGILAVAVGLLAIWTIVSAGRRELWRYRAAGTTVLGGLAVLLGSVTLYGVVAGTQPPGQLFGATGVVLAGIAVLWWDARRLADSLPA